MDDYSGRHADDWQQLTGSFSSTFGTFDVV